MELVADAAEEQPRVILFEEEKQFPRLRPWWHIGRPRENVGVGGLACQRETYCCHLGDKFVNHETDIRRNWELGQLRGDGGTGHPGGRLESFRTDDVELRRDEVRTRRVFLYGQIDLDQSDQ